MRSARESISARPWQAQSTPKKILILRFHAVGDVAITLPWCASLRNRIPDADIDILTGAEAAALPDAVELFDTVFRLDVSGSKWIRLLRVLVWGIRLAVRRYDVVVDLQRNWMSRIVRWLAAPRAWAEFDRYSPIPAGNRVEGTFRRAGFAHLGPTYSLRVKRELLQRGKTLLLEQRWNGKEKLVVINPAGLWNTRNWPLEHYVEFCRMWLEKEPVRFLFMGTDRIRDKAGLLGQALGDSVLDLTGRTTLDEAMAVLQYCSFVLSEDSGLMHMSWTSGVPTLALLGSSPDSWARPLSPGSLCFHSGDLDCGGCNQPVCRFGDVHCLTRFSPRKVFEASESLVHKALAEVAA